jgi:hypothetical protein
MERWAWMSCEIWEEKVLRAPGARERVDEIEGELRVAAGVTRRGEGEDEQLGDRRRERSSTSEAEE